jgi:DNA-binding IclR family transcriptional regulator
MINVLKKAFDVLELIAQEPERPKGLGEIAKPLGLNQATCARILKTLVACDYVDQIAPRKGYVLGPKVYILARKGSYRRDLVRAAESEMAELAKEVQEAVIIATIKEGKRFVLCQVDGSQGLKISNDIVFSDNAYQTATGRLLLAHLSSREFQTFIIRNGLPGDFWPEADTKEKLDTALSQIRKEGMAVVTNGPDVVGVAFPIERDATVVASLGLYLPVLHFSGSHKKKVLSGLKTAAQRISSILLDS